MSNSRKSINKGYSKYTHEHDAWDNSRISTSNSSSSLSPSSLPKDNRIPYLPTSLSVNKNPALAPSTRSPSETISTSLFGSSSIWNGAGSESYDNVTNLKTSSASWDFKSFISTIEQDNSVRRQGKCNIMLYLKLHSFTE